MALFNNKTDKVSVSSPEPAPEEIKAEPEKLEKSQGPSQGPKKEAWFGCGWRGW